MTIVRGSSNLDFLQSELMELQVEVSNCGRTYNGTIKAMDTEANKPFNIRSGFDFHRLIHQNVVPFQ